MMRSIKRVTHLYFLFAIGGLFLIAFRFYYYYDFYADISGLFNSINDSMSSGTGSTAISGLGDPLQSMHSNWSQELATNLDQLVASKISKNDNLQLSSVLRSGEVNILQIQQEVAEAVGVFNSQSHIKGLLSVQLRYQEASTPFNILNRAQLLHQYGSLSEAQMESGRLIYVLTGDDQLPTQLLEALRECIHMPKDTSRYTSLKHTALLTVVLYVPTVPTYVVSKIDMHNSSYLDSLTIAGIAASPSGTVSPEVLDLSQDTSFLIINQYHNNQHRSSAGCNSDDINSTRVKSIAASIIFQIRRSIIINGIENLNSARKHEEDDDDDKDDELIRRPLQLLSSSQTEALYPLLVQARYRRLNVLIPIAVRYLSPETQLVDLSTRRAYAPLASYIDSRYRALRRVLLLRNMTTLSPETAFGNTSSGDVVVVVADERVTETAETAETAETEIGTETESCMDASAAAALAAQLRDVDTLCADLLWYLDILLFQPKDTMFTVPIPLHSDHGHGDDDLRVGTAASTTLLSLSKFQSLFDEPEHKVALYAPFWIPIMYPLFIGLYSLFKP